MIHLTVAILMVQPRQAIPTMVLRTRALYLLAVLVAQIATSRWSRFPAISSMRGDSCVIMKNTRTFHRGMSQLAHVPYLLRGPARTFFDNIEPSLNNSWAVFKEKFQDAYIMDYHVQQKARHELEQRVQHPKESCFDYVQAILKLCRELDSSMPELDIVGHIFKGIAENVFSFLVLQQVDTVDAVLKLCRTLDERLSKRIQPIGSHRQPFQRLPNAPAFPTYPELVSQPVASLSTGRAASVPAAISDALPQRVCSSVALPVNVEQLIESAVKRAVTEQFAAVAAVTNNNAVVDSRGPPRSQPQCYYCHNIGHTQRFCRIRRRDQNNQYRDTSYRYGYQFGNPRQASTAPYYERRFF